MYYAVSKAGFERRIRFSHFWSDLRSHFQLLRRVFSLEVDNMTTQKHDISENCRKKPLSDAKKRALLLKISQNDVLTSTLYCHTMSIIAISIADDYMIFRSTL